jgi:hypothetical protein
VLKSLTSQYATDTNKLPRDQNSCAALQFEISNTAQFTTAGLDAALPVGLCMLLVARAQ